MDYELTSSTLIFSDTTNLHLYLGWIKYVMFKKLCFITILYCFVTAHFMTSRFEISQNFQENILQKDIIFQRETCLYTMTFLIKKLPALFLKFVRSDSVDSLCIKPLVQYLVDSVLYLECSSSSEQSHRSIEVFLSDSTDSLSVFWLHFHPRLSGEKLLICRVYCGRNRVLRQVLVRFMTLMSWELGMELKNDRFPYTNKEIQTPRHLRMPSNLLPHLRCLGLVLGEWAEIDRRSNSRRWRKERRRGETETETKGKCERSGWKSWEDCIWTGSTDWSKRILIYWWWSFQKHTHFYLISRYLILCLVMCDPIPKCSSLPHRFFYSLSLAGVLVSWATT